MHRVQGKKPSVFLSSAFADYVDGRRGYMPLRRRIVEQATSLPVRLWADEHLWPRGHNDARPDADTIVDRCFRGVRDCDLFVFILTGRHGSGVSYREDPVLASYLELELFAAAMLNKPVIVLHQRGREPESQLADALHLLRSLSSTTQYVVDDEEALFRHFVDVCEILAAKEQQPLLHGNSWRLPDRLSVRRSRARIDDELSNPRLRFLDNQLPLYRNEADPDRARGLLDEVASGVRRIDGEQRLMSHGAALCRIWAAMRELTDKDGSALANPEAAQLWDGALGLWATQASWFGLHGHVWMGPLAAINSQLEVRQNLARRPGFSDSLGVREPLGARASAVYSVAQRMSSRWRQLHHFRETMKLSGLALERDGNAQQGVLSIRGHAQFRMAQLGLVWHVLGAESDFRKSLAIRERAGGDARSVGEAKTDLGLLLAVTWRQTSGFQLLEEGVELLRGGESANAKSFLARGLRKLETAAERVGKRDLAASARAERLAITDEIDALDQARPA